MRIVGFGGFPQERLLQHVFELAGADRVLVDRPRSPQYPPRELPGEPTHLSFYPRPPGNLRALGVGPDGEVPLPVRVISP